MELTVGIPCYNEAENITRFPQELFPELRNLGVSFEVLVVDDGSTDKSGDIAEHLGLSEMRVVRHSQNRGLGAGMRTINREARGDLLVTLDADLTFAPADIAKLLERYRQGDVDFVIGSHGLAGYSADIPQYRVVVSKLANVFYSLLTGRWVRGISSLFRLYRTDIVRTLEVTTSGFETPVETFYRLTAAGYRFAEVPTPLGNRTRGVSKLNYKKEGKRHLRLIWAILRGELDPEKKPRDGGVWVIGFFAALLLGTVSFLPNIVMPLTWVALGNAPGDYHALSLDAPTLDELASYGARIREVMDGHWRDGDAFVWEYKGTTSMWGNAFLGMLLGAVARLAALNNPSPLFVWGDFLFPAMMVLAVFGLVRRWVRESVFAGLVAFAVLTFPNIGSLRLGHFSRGIIASFEVVQRLFDFWLVRVAIPAPGLLFLFLFLWMWTRMWEGRWRLPAMLFAGLSLGITIHVYFFYGVFAWVVAGLLLVGACLLRRWQFALRAGVAMAVAAVVALPYGLGLLAARTLPQAAELQARVGVELGRSPRVSLFALGLVCVLLPTLAFLATRLSRRRSAMVLAAALLATLVVQNIQLVTGITVQPDHWGSRVNVYAYALALWIAFAWGVEYLRLSPTRLRRWSIVGLATVVFLTGLVRISAAIEEAPAHGLSRDMQAAFTWIDAHTPMDSVILTPSTRTMNYLPFFTHANVYLPSACFSVAPSVEIRERWRGTARVFGITEELFVAAAGDADKTKNKVRANVMDPHYTLFCETYSALQSDGFIRGDSRRVMPPEVFAELRQELRDIAAAPPPDRITLPYRVDYLFYGPNERFMSTRDPSRYQNVRLVFHNDSVRIYAVEP